MVGRDLGKVKPWNILSKTGTISQPDDFIGCMVVRSVRLALELEQCNGWSLHGPQDRRQRSFGLPQQRVYTVGWPTVCREPPAVDPARVPTDICMCGSRHSRGRAQAEESLAHEFGIEGGCMRQPRRLPYWVICQPLSYCSGTVCSTPS